MQDFEPYFCIFDNCNAPFEVPNTFQGLLSHLQGHCPERWYIQTPDGQRLEFEDEKAFEAQILEQEACPETLMSTLKHISRQRAPLFLDNCPFCGGYPDTIEKLFPDRRSLDAQHALRKHIKEHMHNIALFLPPYRDELWKGAEVADTNSSVDIRPQSARALDDTISQISTCDREECDCKNVSPFFYEVNDDTGSQSADPGCKETSDFWPELFRASSIYSRLSPNPYDHEADPILATFVASSQSLFLAKWYCCQCMEGPYGSWHEQCQTCTHTKCNNCDDEV